MLRELSYLIYWHEESEASCDSDTRHIYADDGWQIYLLFSIFRISRFLSTLLHCFHHYYYIYYSLDDGLIFCIKDIGHRIYFHEISSRNVSIKVLKIILRAYSRPVTVELIVSISHRKCLWRGHLLLLAGFTAYRFSFGRIITKMTVFSWSDTATDKWLPLSVSQLPRNSR